MTWLSTMRTFLPFKKWLLHTQSKNRNKIKRDIDYHILNGLKFNAAQRGWVLKYILFTGRWNTIRGRTKILASKWRLCFWVACKLWCFRLVTITFFEGKTGYLFREIVLEKRFAGHPSNRIRKILLDLNVQNQLLVNLHTSHVQYMKRKDHTKVRFTWIT